MNDASAPPSTSHKNVGMSNNVKLALAFLYGFLAAKVLDAIWGQLAVPPADALVNKTMVEEFLKESLQEPCPPVAPASGTRTGFDEIVALATSTSHAPVNVPKNKFDVNWWETASGLNTTGGLRTKDRILLSQLYGNASSVFEYGLGESTNVANYVGVPRYAGVDSDANYVTGVRDKNSDHFRFYFADVGSTGYWGKPRRTLAKSVYNYQLAPLVAEPRAFDVYMVDGRWRMACALACFLHASARGAPHKDTKVLIHDCNNPAFPRPAYNRGDHLLDLEEHSGARLCVFKRKAATTDEQLMKLWQEVADDTTRRL